MKEYLLQDDGRYIECTLDGLKLTYTCSDDPRYHYEAMLRSRVAYVKLKNMIQKIYESYKDASDGYANVREFLASTDSDEFFTKDGRMLYTDIRDIDEIRSYEEEASDKVWLMRSRPGECPEGVARIMNRYDDIPEKRLFYLGMRILEWNSRGIALGDGR